MQRRAALAMMTSIGTASVAGCLQRDYESLAGLEGTTSPDWSSTGAQTREFNWTALERAWTWSVSIPDSLVSYYERRPRTNAMGQYVADPFDDDYVASIADEFRAGVDRYDLSERDVVDSAMAFVQQLRYTSDAVATGFDESHPIQSRRSSPRVVTVRIRRFCLRLFCVNLDTASCCWRSGIGNTWLWEYRARRNSRGSTMITMGGATTTWRRRELAGAWVSDQPGSRVPPPRFSGSGVTRFSSTDGP
ncbi:MAG: hypothetical protein U5K37_08195 [Natrialbaceae archaeon]|nr:hypothetical protein [Natrialbaceae archaeon]